MSNAADGIIVIAALKTAAAVFRALDQGVEIGAARRMAREYLADVLDEAMEAADRLTSAPVVPAGDPAAKES